MNSGLLFFELIFFTCLALWIAAGFYLAGLRSLDAIFDQYMADAFAAIDRRDHGAIKVASRSMQLFEESRGFK